MNSILKAQLEHKINYKTKPLGALGVLEALALQAGLVQNTLSPVLNKPAIIVFAGDHGIAREGVSAYPPEVTFQMVMNFLQGGAAINVFCRQHGIDLQVVDAGVNFDFEPAVNLINAKIAKGTASFLQGKAITEKQLQQCKEKAEALIEQLAATGCNVVGFGEMGIGNTSAAAMIMSSICNIPVAECVGRGTGLNDEQLAHKTAVLNQAITFHGPLGNAREVLQTYGGFEIAQMCMAMLAAHDKNMLILVDGFIAGSAFLVAHALRPAIKENAVFCHLSNEQAHRQLLAYLRVTPLLNLGMRLGEGTGCAVAFPLLQSAVAFLNEMASFETAGVSNKES
jgi:nicotinate-nucleotide--dimethylbenzimidazole phosphoribosyltransferase